jgi:hypothetical protein
VTALVAGLPTSSCYGTDPGHIRPVAAAYYGSDAVASRRVCRDLERLGPHGRLAASLYRAQKASARAKVYRSGPRGRRGSYRALAYERKGQHLEAVVALLEAEPCGLQWGWGRDDTQVVARWVLYVDLPVGQVSFHSTRRFAGPDYLGTWDGQLVSEERVVRFCDTLLAGSGHAPTAVQILTERS